MTKVILAGSAIITGTGLSVTALAYRNSYESIFGDLKEDLLPTNKELETSWTKLKEKLGSLQEITDKDLNNLKNKSSIESHELKEWCDKAYSQTYKSWFVSENKKLKEDVKKACILKIRDQMNSENVFEIDSDQNKAAMTKNLEKLNSWDDKHARLDNALIDIKNSQENSDDNNQKWKKLQSWCKNAYERGYQGEKSNIWLLTQKLCKKEN